MNSEDFPLCCGIDILVDLHKIYGDTEYWDEDKSCYCVRKSDFAEELKCCISEPMENNKGLVLTVTTNKTKDKIPVLKKFGFILLKDLKKSKLWGLDVNKVSESKMDKLVKSLKDK